MSWKLLRTRRSDNYIAVLDEKGNVVCDNMEFYPAPLDPRNAPLISAAPDLLEALKAVTGHEDYMGMTFSDRMELVKKAFAKVEGKE